MSDDIYADIRPYNDDELRQVLNRLVKDPELCEVIAKYKFPKMWRFVKPFVSKTLHKYTRDITSIKALQSYVAEYMDFTIKKTTDGLTVSGIDQLNREASHLFVSNHRDIAMDPALTNIALHRTGLETVRIAIGDNLLSKDFISDLMRLNKSFLVRRSMTGKALFKALKTLSSYIKHSIDTNNSVWIAQKEGRAKDGRDLTDPTIIKMFDMGRAKGEDFSQYLASLHIVPLSIAYEWDPCDLMKARELAAKHATGSYQKKEGEDITSIATGISGYKGRVHLHFGAELLAGFNDPVEVAAAIDASIVGNYHLFHSNWLAYQKLYGSDADHLFKGQTISAQTHAEMDKRVSQCHPDMVPFLLQQYANPVVAKLKFERGDGLA
jgi:glycerol-3-phosphate O-acyltransferase